MSKRSPQKPAARPAARFTFHEVDRKRWADLAALFEAPGGPKYCWCMVWRPLADRGEASGRQRRAALQRQVRAGVPVGLLAYLGKEPIGWCSVAPRATYRPLGGVDDPDEGVWSVVCFFVPRAQRGKGLMKQMLAAAARTARRHGARVLEAYPVDKGSPSYRFMGFVPLFRAAGFRHVGRAGTRRHVMRLDLTRRKA